MKLRHACVSGVIVIWMTISVAMADSSKLPGYTEGVRVIQVTPTRQQTDAISDVTYAQVKSLTAVRPLHMSFLIPRTTHPRPAIIYFPGGGFVSASYNQFIEMRMALAEAGFVVVAAEYRTVPDVFPAPVVDGKAAVRYIRAHAKEYGIDPKRIGVLGDSAGGWLAQMLGTTNGEKTFDKGDFLNQSSDIQAVVTLYGISDLLNIGAGFSGEIQKIHQSPASNEALLVNGTASVFNHFAGASIIADLPKSRYASPAGHINDKKPPFLIMHGSKDTLVSPEQSAQLYRALRKVNSPAEYVLVDGAGHADIYWFQQPVINHVVNWFCKTLEACAPDKSEL